MDASGAAEMSSTTNMAAAEHVDDEGDTEDAQRTASAEDDVTRSIANQMFHQVLFDTCSDLPSHCWPQDLAKKRKKDAAKSCQADGKRSNPPRKDHDEVNGEEEPEEEEQEQEVHLSGQDLATIREGVVLLVRSLLRLLKILSLKDKRQSAVNCTQLFTKLLYFEPVGGQLTFSPQQDGSRLKTLPELAFCGLQLLLSQYHGDQKEVIHISGLWLGVEWDNSERGKHDGSHAGVQYFTCRHPTGGSFVRPKKASAQAFGVDFMSAVRDLYHFNVEEVFGQQTIISSKTVEVSGFNKNRTDGLAVVSLRQLEVSSPGPVDQIQTFMPDVRSLDLCGNLLCSWEDVAEITKNMKHLGELLLSFNRLAPTSSPSSLSHAFSSLTVLSLASCQLTWTQLLQCAPMWPQLEELYVAENDITELSRPLDVLQDLRVLDLSSNPLVQESVLHLAHLPRLKNLNLSSTELSDLKFQDVLPGVKTRMFIALKVLILNHNRISQWSVVNELDKLQSLVELSCRHNNQLTNGLTPQTANQLIIAKLPQLALLNKSRVLPEDRRGAELDYIKRFGEEWLASGGHRDPDKNRPSAEFTSMHPRYLPLIHKYGAPEEGELKKQAPFALKNQLISLTMVCPEEEGRPPIIKKLPDSMTVQKVKGLLSRMLKVPGAAINLAYTGPKMNGSEVELDNDLKPLQFYSIEDGDSLIVRRALPLTPGSEPH